MEGRNAPDISRAKTSPMTGKYDGPHGRPPDLTHPPESERSGFFASAFAHILKQPSFPSDLSDMDFPVDGTAVKLRDIKKGKVSGSLEWIWSISQEQREDFADALEFACHAVIDERTQFRTDVPALDAVFNEKSLNSTKVAKIQAREPKSILVAAQRLARLTNNLFDPKKRDMHPNDVEKYAKKTMSAIDTGANATVLGFLQLVERYIDRDSIIQWKSLKDLYEHSWETAVEISELATREGVHKLHFKGELLEDLTDWGKVGEAAAELAGVHLDYWEKVALLKEEIRSGIQDEARLSQLLSEEGLGDENNSDYLIRKGQLMQGIQNERDLDATLRVHGVYPEMLVNRLDAQDGRETMLPIKPSERKVMIVDPHGNLITVSASAWMDDDTERRADKRVLVQQSIAAWMSGSVTPERKRDLKRELEEYGCTIWDSLDAAGAGYPKSIEDRFQAFKLHDIQGKPVAHSDAFRGVVAVIGVGDQLEKCRTLALPVPEFTYINVSRNSDASLKEVHDVVMLQSHKQADAMPHQRMAAAIIPEFVGRWEQRKKENAPGITAEDMAVITIDGMEQMRMDLNMESPGVMNEWLKKDEHYNGQRMHAETFFHLSVTDMEQARRSFTQITKGKEDEGGRGRPHDYVGMQFARTWIEANVPRKTIKKIASEMCGPAADKNQLKGKMNLVREQMAQDLYRFGKETMKNYTDVSGPFLAATGELFQLARWGETPSLLFPAEVFQRWEFLKDRASMGAALLTLDKDLAKAGERVVYGIEDLKLNDTQEAREALSIALSNFQLAMLERIFRMRMGTANVQTKHGLALEYVVAAGGRVRKALADKASRLIPKTYTDTPPAKVLMSDSIVSALTPPKGHLRSIFDSHLSLRDGLGTKELSLTTFDTSREGFRDMGVSMGLVPDRTECIEDRSCNWGVKLELLEPTLLRLLSSPSLLPQVKHVVREVMQQTDYSVLMEYPGVFELFSPEEKQFLLNELPFGDRKIEILAKLGSTAKEDQPKNTEEAIRHLYRISPVFREAMAPLQQKRMKEYATDYQRLMDVMMFATGTDPELIMGSEDGSIQPLQVNDLPELPEIVYYQDPKKGLQRDMWRPPIDMMDPEDLKNVVS